LCSTTIISDVLLIFAGSANCEAVTNWSRASPALRYWLNILFIKIILRNTAVFWNKLKLQKWSTELRKDRFHLHSRFFTER